MVPDGDEVDGDRAVRAARMEDWAVLLATPLPADCASSRSTHESRTGPAFHLKRWRSELHPGHCHAHGRGWIGSHERGQETENAIPDFGRGAIPLVAKLRL